MNVRPAERKDIPAVTGIYGASVLSEPISFETEPPDETEMVRRWQAVIESGHPYFVAVSGEEVVGYCYASAYHTRPAYAATVECSVYVHQDHRRSGAGRALMTTLLEACKTNGSAQMIAIIGDSGNTGSIGLHASLGFRHVGVLEKVGYKFGRWLDVVIMQREL
ncbi:MAG: GNAT family N-acetyltransferase [Hyphomicrobiaceae bacterium]